MPHRSSTEIVKPALVFNRSKRSDWSLFAFIDMHSTAALISLRSRSDCGTFDIQCTLFTLDPDVIHSYGGAEPAWHEASASRTLDYTDYKLIYVTADEADAYMFQRCFFSLFFCFFPPVTKIPDNRSRERLNGFS